MNDVSILLSPVLQSRREQVIIVHLEARYGQKFYLEIENLNPARPNHPGSKYVNNEVQVDGRVLAHNRDNHPFRVLVAALSKKFVHGADYKQVFAFPEELTAEESRYMRYASRRTHSPHIGEITLRFRFDTWKECWFGPYRDSDDSSDESDGRRSPPLPRRERHEKEVTVVFYYYLTHVPGLVNEPLRGTSGSVVGELGEGMDIDIEKQEDEDREPASVREDSRSRNGRHRARSSRQPGLMSKDLDEITRDINAFTHVVFAKTCEEVQDKSAKRDLQTTICVLKQGIEKKKERQSELLRELQESTSQRVKVEVTDLTMDDD
ncbi:hypothetical protein EIP91_010440 [Steccherinum ochraceum]|uniref:Uncharacterized protein n=1 Tax=Steccherinum ochraceum TaxID=92696 RepID=A0A4R0R2T6_9APHY|nr:hypothetical protein EIP91_010440 [Steccherinum ochraceum]